MNKRNKKQQLKQELKIIALDLLHEEDHQPPNGHDDEHCCGTCKNSGKCTNTVTHIEPLKDNNKDHPKK
ncbi:MAG: hypothetical protein IT267_11285 [Saprospiraceae bacterium]|nr:hypothetical protein [Saprospiraceae bacterium]